MQEKRVSSMKKLRMNVDPGFLLSSFRYKRKRHQLYADAATIIYESVILTEVHNDAIIMHCPIPYLFMYRLM